MVSTQFHFNGFFPNMLYFFILSFFLRRLYLLTPTFIIEPAFAAFSVRYYNLSVASQKCNEERSFCLPIPLFQFLYGEVNYPLNLYKFQPYRFQAHTCYCKKKSLARHSPM